MKNVCPHCGAPLSESESVCHACGGFIEAPVS
ncbi:MAG: zinc-ribbon domain-containing protein, partial [Solobacterium sp.]|nr:zinc-ribbon domain-containing protein [Solobacterium sp.]